MASTSEETPNIDTLENVDHQSSNQENASKKDPKLVFPLLNLLDDSELIGEHGPTGFKIYTADLRHLPLLIPMIEKYYEGDSIAKALGIKGRPEIMWPLAYNSLRYRISCFGVLNGKIVMLATGMVNHVRGEDDSLLAADYPTISKNDPANVFFEMEKHLEEFLQENEEDYKVFNNDIIILSRELRGKKLGLFSHICLARLLMKQGPSLNIRKVYAVATGVANMNCSLKAGYEVVGEMPDSLYIDASTGKAFRPADGGPNAAILRMDLEKMREEREEYCNLDEVYRI